MNKKIIVTILALTFGLMASSGRTLVAPEEPINVKEPGVGIQPGGRLMNVGGGYMDPNSGDYWWWDDAEPTQPFFDPPVGVPDIGNWVDIANDGETTPFQRYNDRCAVKTMPDSFWYYGVWYTKEDGDKLYISPDGWVSWDPLAEPGNSTPHEDFPQDGTPEAVIAAFWTPLNPTNTTGTPVNGDPDAIYYKYDASARAIIIEWYQVSREVNPAEWYTFEMILMCGGKGFLFDEGCGPIYSFHTIDLMYDSHNGTDWKDLPEFIVGWENHPAPTGRLGVTIASDEQNADEIRDGRAIRIMFRKVFKHDVAAQYIYSPGSMVLRWTELEPEVVVANMGREVEHFLVTFKIYKGSDVVYNQNREVYDLPSYDPADPTRHLAEITFPCWKPEEYGTKYKAELSVELATDEYECNDVLERDVEVRCDDTLSYDWNMDVWIGWGYTSEIERMTNYPLNNGGLITGGAWHAMNAYPPGKPWAGVVWGDICVLSGTPDIGTNKEGESDQHSTHAVGWNEWEINPPSGIWAHSTDPGGIGIGVHTWGYPPYIYESPLRKAPPPHVCFPSIRYRSGRWYRGRWYWGAVSGGSYVIINRGYGHLIFGDWPLSPHPAPPCYYDNAHDLKAYEIKNPPGDYVQADSSITPEIGIVNIGRQAEPDEGYFYVTFWAVKTETGETHKLDSTGVDHIGYLGDDTDDPDTLYVPISSWTPEGQCVYDGSGVEYEIYGIVRLPEVGPPGKPKADHCNYNDTLKKTVTALLAHDVGVSEITKPTVKEASPGDVIELECIVENFGYNNEANIEVHCEIYDCGPAHVSATDPDSIVYTNVKMIDALSWRGNPWGEPYTETVTFPSWTYPAELEGHKEKIQFYTELPGDLCPIDDAKSWQLNWVGIEEITPETYAFEIVGNPFVSTAVVKYALPVNEFVSIKVYDISGKLVKTLVSGNVDAGYYNLKWDGTDDSGRRLAEGIYFVKMTTPSYRATKKVILAR